MKGWWEGRVDTDRNGPVSWRIIITECIKHLLVDAPLGSGPEHLTEQ